jgi:NAD(P) transhydrogenase subunit alpha
VIVDMAAERGGNCELTEPGKAVVKHGVTIVGYTDLNSRLAKQSSTLYATNLFRLSRGTVQDQGRRDRRQYGRRRHPRPDGDQGRAKSPGRRRRPSCRRRRRPSRPPPQPPAKKGGHGHGAASEPMAGNKLAIMFAVAAALFWFVGANAPAAFLAHFTVFVLACFVGYMVVWNVTPALHTPLMSVTNAISSIICIGALVQIAPPLAGGAPPDTWIRWLAVGGIALTAVNMFGGFAVTQRMLDMFRK